MRKYGVLYDITVRVPSTWKANLNHTSRLRGMSVSITSTSLLKRLTTRPIGVVSKNDIGARRIVYSSWACSFPVAFVAPTTRENDAKYTHRATNIPYIVSSTLNNDATSVWYDWCKHAQMSARKLWHMIWQFWIPNAILIFGGFLLFEGHTTDLGILEFLMEFSCFECGLATR